MKIRLFKTLVLVLFILPLCVLSIISSILIEIPIIATIYWIITGKNGLRFVYEYGSLNLVDMLIKKFIRK